MPYDLSKMKLLARGGQADVYEIDAGKVLRVLRDPQGADMLVKERAIMEALHERGVGVPEIYGCAEVGGLPALVIQRISGPSMLQAMMRDPFSTKRIARELARLHKDVLGSPAIDGLTDSKDRTESLTDRMQGLDEKDRAFVRGVLSALPDGKTLLHGDFHPANILTDSGRSYIIDWFGATMGHFLSDVAHTYVLLADKPRIPGESFLKHRFLKAFAKLFAGMYLQEVRALTGFSMDEFGKWAAVRAAERTAYGHPSELASKARFVKACRAMQEKGVPASQWHKVL